MGSTSVCLNTYVESRTKYGIKYFVLTNRKIAKRLGSKLIHVLIAERILGRDLFKNEVVHHVDGDGLNNNIKNLCVMTRSEHTSCRYSMQKCAMKFYNKVVDFSKGVYYVK